MRAKATLIAPFATPIIYYFCREEFAPTANLREITPDQVRDYQKPWNFNSLPGVNLKASSLLENPEHLERLCNKLKELEPLALWHEPLDLDEHAESFFVNIKEVLTKMAADCKDKSQEEIPSEAKSITSNAICSSLGLAILSGNFALIIKALETLN